MLTAPALESTKTVELTRGQIWAIKQRGQFAMHTGYGGGKTMAGCVVMDVFSRSLANDRDIKSAAYIFVEPTFQMTKDIAIPRMVEFCQIMGYIWTWQDKTSKLMRVQAWGYEYIIYFRSGENFESWRGMEGTHTHRLFGAVMDEAALMSREVFRVLLPRVNRRAQNENDYFLFASTTPPLPTDRHRSYNPYWLYEVFDNIYEGSTLENKFLPNIESYAEMITEEVGEEYARALVHGQRVDAKTGRLFWLFDEKRNVIDNLPMLSSGQRLDPLREKEIIAGFDFNINPMTCIVFIEHQGTLYSFKYFRSSQGGTRGMAREVCQWLKGFQGTVILDGDPSGKRTMTSSENTERMTSSLSDYDIIADEFRKHNIKHKFVAADCAPSVHGSADTVNIAFEKLLFYVVRNNEPNVKHVIDDLNHDPNEKENRKRWKENNPLSSHGSDIVRYVLSNIFGGAHTFESIAREKIYKQMRVT